MNEDCNSLFQFANTYKPIHGYLSTFLCAFGIPSNILNIIVLTRPNLIASPTNLILTSLAISDLLTMCSYLPYAVWFYIVFSESYFCKEFSFILARDSKFWTTYSLVHVNFSVTVHSISIWLTVYLAIFRYIYLQSSSLAVEVNSNSVAAATLSKRIRSCLERFIVNFRSYNSCLIWIILVCVFCLIFCSPAYFIYFIDKQPHNDTAHSDSNYNKTTAFVYFLKDTQLNLSTNNFIFKLTFYTQAIFAKLIPCILLVTFSSLLIRSLVIINRNNRKLKHLNLSPKKQTATATPSHLTLPLDNAQHLKNTASMVKKKSRNRTKEHLRTTLMLVIVCVLFLITELPQCILIFLSIILNEQGFYARVYMPLGDTMDIIALLNNSINFILYCIMSRAFRTTFYVLIMNGLGTIRRLLPYGNEAATARDRNLTQPRPTHTGYCRADSIKCN